ncbi:MAG: CBS domain-containing protein [Planctomycetales bacterium]|nr:CBS domain-containing protein [Planctomycetales bacterium]NIP68988.1 CBS domain-containing protein [Planctomycetales bacterium]
MKWSLKLGSVAGIGIFVHWTFLILIAWIVYVHSVQGSDLGLLLRGITFVLAVFGCIVLHELGHALTAQRFGIRTRDITLLPIGGLARLERMPEEPNQELLIALAGPAVNVVIAAVLALSIAVVEGALVVNGFQPIGGPFLIQLMLVNVILVVFNLIPAFPMDGGRVLRAVLARRLDYAHATEIAAAVGQVVAILFGILGLMSGNFFLLFIALFVYLGAQQEAHFVQVRSLLRGVPTRQAMVTRFRMLAEDDSLDAVLDELMAGEQQDFPVVRNGQLVGILGRGDLMRQLTEGGRDALVGDVMRRDCRTVEDHAMLEDTFQLMREEGCRMLPVVHDGRLVGMLTLENVGEWMMIQSALRQAKARGQVDDIYRPAG